MAAPIFYNDFGDFDNEGRDEEDDGKDVEEEDDEDDLLIIDADSLGDWRAVRRSLAAGEEKHEATLNKTTTTGGGAASGSNKSKSSTPSTSSSRSNEQLLAQQNAKLAMEYQNDVWAHETATVRRRKMEAIGTIFLKPLRTNIQSC